MDNSVFPFLFCSFLGTMILFFSLCKADYGGQETWEASL